MRAVAVLPLLLLAAWAEPASAHVERFAVLIGNDLGTPEETPLRYATADALRMQTVLRELGGFEPFNMVLLRNEDAATARSTLLSMNERIREAVARPNTDVLFLVYYSGHADARQLHLGDSELPVRELAQIVRGSAATFRLVVLDACRSGTLTRVKGGRVVDPFALPNDRLPGDGLAYLTSASASEDAQESDRLQGSFFTHSLISGLMGAADRDGNGSVVLEEAYRYAYDATRRATSRTRAGTQHPTFRYDFRGSGQLVLTRPGAQPHTRGRLLFPSGMSFMLMRDDEDGAVVAELSSRAPRRELSVRPGRYFVRARGTDVLFEGEVRVGAGASRQVDAAEMRRIEYAQLVRKGEGRARLAQGPEAGMRVRSPLPNEADACIGAFGGYAIDFASFGSRVRVSGCRSGFDNVSLQANNLVVDLEARAHRAWDLSRFTVELGVGGGLGLHTQRFVTAGHAPTRQTAAPFLIVAAGAAADLGGGYSLGLDLAAETHYMRVQMNAGARASGRVAFALRPTLSVAKDF